MEKYFCFQIDSEYLTIDLENQYDKILKAYASILNLFEEEQINQPSRFLQKIEKVMSHNEFDKNVDDFFSSVSEFGKPLMTIMQDVEVIKRRLLFQYLNSAYTVFDNMSSLDNSKSHSLAFICSTSRVVEDLYICYLMLFCRKSGHLSLYIEGCKKLGMSSRRFFALLQNGISLYNDLLNDCTLSLQKDILFFSQQFTLKMQQVKYSPTIPNSSEIKEYSQIAQLAYEDNITIEGYIPFVVKDITNDYGYFENKGVYGYIFKKTDKLIITFGGTYLNKICAKAVNTLITDFMQICTGSYSYIVGLGIVSKIVSQYADRPLFICGHSLGGGITQFSIAPFSDKTSITGFTYNSAGLSRASLKMIRKCSKKINVTHIRMVNDFVSKYGKLLEGKIYYIDSNNIGCCESHKIETIVKYFGKSERGMPLQVKYNE